MSLKYEQSEAQLKVDAQNDPRIALSDEAWGAMRLEQLPNDHSAQLTQPQIDQAISGLHSDRDEVRAHSYKTLKQAGPEVLPALQTALGSNNDHARMYARYVLDHRIEKQMGGVRPNDAKWQPSLPQWAEAFENEEYVHVDARRGFLNRLQQEPEIKNQARTLEELRGLEKIVRTEKCYEDKVQYATLGWLNGRIQEIEDPAGARREITTVKLQGETICKPDQNIDAMLGALKTLPNLTELDMSYKNEKQLTDGGLKKIAELHKLESLELRGTFITDNGIAHIATMKNLQNLEVGFSSKLTDNCTKDIAKLTELRGLDLSFTAVSDAGLRNLSGLKHLTHLNLERTSVSDVSVDALANMKALKCLMLDGSKITRQGADKLLRALPQCEIFWKKDEERHRNAVPSSVPLA